MDKQEALLEVEKVAIDSLRASSARTRAYLLAVEKYGTGGSREAIESIFHPDQCPKCLGHIFDCDCAPEAMVDRLRRYCESKE